MKRKSLFLIIILLTIISYNKKDQIIMAFTHSPVHISGEAAVLMDQNTGKIIFSKNQNAKLYPASTTKLLTALVVLDGRAPNEKVKIGKEVYLQTEGEARVGLFEGQVQTVEELLAAMLLQSGNDAARSLAVYTAIQDKKMSEPEAIQYFADLMNTKAKEIGANHSNFVNPHGLHDENHFSTAYDLALIAKEAKKNKIINSLVSQQIYSTKTHTYKNRNQLLDPNSSYYYEDATGLKTGFTDQAGYCLISSANRGSKNLISVVLHSGKESMWTDSISLLDYGFAEDKEKKLAQP
ncbi:D-alanyl-D-alanine carboxypeptidase family protein [Lederbergia wuyishanensis]|uniref:D-alanyl-D-alanine carboxypeptidase n=1 Tax=Lederbergia wuyishanensis TaxID=1347903 RepID=A0ABU0D4P9_9BACI|nr:D-alanyl-D-alanine carboxypeptidase family protein [Lederbergia wuyishanensis]MCJ8008046.1 D-alanyl-D-alanine carboxypeptidase [Lederbergia wuyishanensis]MDQ0343369.1 D-alanyl-D-alanine carboxypeptidase [Lederbergia wuyishanensis]